MPHTLAGDVDEMLVDMPLLPSPQSTARSHQHAWTASKSNHGCGHSSRYCAPADSYMDAACPVLLGFSTIHDAGYHTLDADSGDVIMTSSDDCTGNGAHPECQQQTYAAVATAEDDNDLMECGQPPEAVTNSSAQRQQQSHALSSPPASPGQCTSSFHHEAMLLAEELEDMVLNVPTASNSFHAEAMVLADRLQHLVLDRPRDCNSFHHEAMVLAQSIQALVLGTPSSTDEKTAHDISNSHVQMDVSTAPPAAAGQQPQVLHAGEDRARASSPECAHTHHSTSSFIPTSWLKPGCSHECADEHSRSPSPEFVGCRARSPECAFEHARSPSPQERCRAPTPDCTQEPRRSPSPQTHEPTRSMSPEGTAEFTRSPSPELAQRCQAPSPDCGAHQHTRSLSPECVQRCRAPSPDFVAAAVAGSDDDDDEYSDGDEGRLPGAVAAVTRGAGFRQGLRVMIPGDDIIYPDYSPEGNTSPRSCGWCSSEDSGDDSGDDVDEAAQLRHEHQSVAAFTGADTGAEQRSSSMQQQAPQQQSPRLPSTSPVLQHIQLLPDSFVGIADLGHHGGTDTGKLGLGDKDVVRFQQCSGNLSCGSGVSCGCAQLLLILLCPMHLLVQNTLQRIHG